MKKKIVCVFAVLVLVFAMAVPAFAVVSVPTTIPSWYIGTEKSGFPYYVIYKIDDSTYRFFDSSSPFVYDGVTYAKGSSSYVNSNDVTVVNNYSDYTSSGWGVVTRASFSVVTASTIVLSNADICNSGGSVFFQGTVPPYLAVAKVVKPAIQAVPSSISLNISVLLAVGLTILAILLGVSLIPRVISSFK